MHRSVIASLSIALTCAIAATTASAQQAAPFRFEFKGGYSETVGQTTDYLQGGYSFGAAVRFTPSRDVPLDLRLGLNYADYNASNYLLNLGQQNTGQLVTDGDTAVFSVNGDLLMHVPLGYGITGYGLAGIGAYHLHVALNQTYPYGGYGYGYFYCSPFDGYCYDSATVASYGVNKFGWNAGVGLEFALPWGHSWFIEARYVRINTSTPAEFVPIEVGYRF